MLDDFFVRALLAGVGIAAIAGPIGCFVVWRRMAYMGDTMAHSALLGVALAVLAGVLPALGVFAVAAALALVLLGLQSRGDLATDTLLGLLSHASLAIGLIVVSFMSFLRIDLMGLLFGDILAVSRFDLVVIYGGGLVALALLAAVWRPLLADTVSPELARAENLPADRARLVFTLLLAGVIAVAIKLVGALLITALLIVPAATARRLARDPVVMAGLAAAIGAVAALSGLYGSLAFDTPSGPSIVVAAVVLFAVSRLIPAPRAGVVG